MSIRLTITHYSPCIVLVYELKSDQQGLICLINVEQIDSEVKSTQIRNLPDGNYRNLLADLCIDDIPKDQSSSIITVTNNGHIPNPAIVSVLYYSDFLLHPHMFYSESIDFVYHGM